MLVKARYITASVGGGTGAARHKRHGAAHVSEQGSREQIRNANLDQRSWGTSVKNDISPMRVNVGKTIQKRKKLGQRGNGADAEACEYVVSRKGNGVKLHGIAKPRGSDRRPASRFPYRGDLVR